MIFLQCFEYKDQYFCHSIRIWHELSTSWHTINCFLPCSLCSSCKDNSRSLKAHDFSQDLPVYCDLFTSKHPNIQVFSFPLALQTSAQAYVFLNDIPFYCLPPNWDNFSNVLSKEHKIFQAFITLKMFICIQKLYYSFFSVSL